MRLTFFCGVGVVAYAEIVLNLPEAIEQHIQPKDPDSACQKTDVGSFHIVNIPTTKRRKFEGPM